MHENTLAKLKANNQILWQYANAQGELIEDANPNGSLENIAGICNDRRNVAGLMPHPERASEVLMGGLANGKLVFDSMIAALESKGRKIAA
jgi:phosphoribosylformylglycinamidine (FGAM) synthase-like amidotransferase family enzyme